MDKIKLFYLFLKGDWKTSLPGLLLLIATGLYVFHYIDEKEYGVITGIAVTIIGVASADRKSEAEKQQIFDDRSDKRDAEKPIQPTPTPRPPYKPVGK